MFKKLHRQMTFFCTFITSAILIVLTLICILISERSLTNNNLTSFLKDINAMITHLQVQNTLSLQWMNQLQENGHFYLFFYDNGTPFFSQRLNSDSTILALADEVLAYSKNVENIDISSSGSNQLPVHEEFSFTGTDKKQYYVSAGVIPRSGNAFGFLLIYPLASQQRQIFIQRLLFAAADVVAIILLAVFSWIFTGRMMDPLARNRKKQTQFIAAASHELRTPLAVILSGTEALEKSTTYDERGHFIHMIREEGVRMQRLIADMLLLANSDSKSFSIQKSLYQPDELLLSAHEKFETQAHKKGVSMLISLPETPLPDCNCDAERIQQVLSILIDNALFYTPAGGKITLSLSVTKLPSASDPKFCFHVQDTGPGIPDEEKSLIFERFYRSQSSRADKNHFGLGLCIALEIISAHHGTIYVEDADGGGSVFIVEL